MALWRLYYHLVWATKERQPMILAEVEPELYGYMIGKAYALGCITHAVGGVEDHIHLVVSIPPKLSISDFVGQIKGSSAHHLNHEVPVGLATTFGWQRGYGIFSLGYKQLADAVSYVTNQKTHHRQGTTIAVLEKDSEEDDCPSPWQNGEAISGIKIVR